MNARAAAACGATLVILTFGVLLGARSPEARSADGVVRAPARYENGAPPGFSGGFNEQSCHACHFHAGINAGSGRVAIAGVPERFLPGERYPVTVTLTAPGIVLGGFQLTARFKDGGVQAGALGPAPEDAERIGVEVQGNVQYAGQREKGAALTAPNTARWALVWTAPTASGPVAFHVAANAANGDERVDGDYIYTTVAETSPAGQW